MLKRLLMLIALVWVFNASFCTAQAVTDEAGLLSAEEVELLNQRIRNVEQAHNIKLGVAFVKTIGGRDMVTASNDLLDKNFANGVNGGIVLLVDMDKRRYELSTDRRMIDRITDFDGIPFLKERFEASLSAGNYYRATSNFIDGVDELLIYYETNGRAYGQSPPDEFEPMAAALAVVIGLLMGVAIRSWLIGSMSNIRHAMEAIDYLKRDTVKLTENRDTFLFMNVQRRAKGGGGRSSGGGSHGGGGHGGGGGSF